MDDGFRVMPLYGGPLDGDTIDASRLTDAELRDGLALPAAGGAYPGGRAHYALDDTGVMRWQGDTP